MTVDAREAARRLLASLGVPLGSTTVYVRWSPDGPPVLVVYYSPSANIPASRCVEAFEGLDVEYQPRKTPKVEG